ncbi:MAG: hypothetical protein R3F65_23725 [bacterium]
MLDETDDEALDAAVQALAQIDLTARLTAALLRGQVIDFYLSTGGATLRKLAQRVGTSHVQLQRERAVYRLLTEHPDLKRLELPYQHFALVTPLPAPDQRRLLRAAKDGQWTQVRLRHEVSRARRRRPATGKGGRPTLPAAAKAVTAMMAALNRAGGGAIPPADVSGVRGFSRERLMERVRALREWCDAVLEQEGDDA